MERLPRSGWAARISGGTLSPEVIRSGSVGSLTKRQSLGGRSYYRKIAIDGKPLTQKQSEREDAKMEQESLINR